MESSGGLNENMEGSGRSRGLVIITAAVTVTVRNAQEKLPARATVLGVESGPRGSRLMGWSLECLQAES